MTSAIRLCCLGLALVLAGCASGGGGPSLYVLDHDYPDAKTATAAATDRPALVVAPVAVAPFLNDSGIVYQTAAHRVVLANNNRWASPLAAQLGDGLYATLAGELSGVTVLRGRRNAPANALHLSTRVDEFMGHYDGSAHIAGQWTLTDAHGERLIQRSFNRRVPLAEDGYDALVESLSRGWRQTARAMAGAIAPRIAAHDEASTP